MLLRTVHPYPGLVRTWANTQINETCPWLKLSWWNMSDSNPYDIQHISEGHDRIHAGLPFRSLPNKLSSFQELPERANTTGHFQWTMQRPVFEAVSNGRQESKGARSVKSYRSTEKRESQNRMEEVYRTGHHGLEFIQSKACWVYEFINTMACMSPPFTIMHPFKMPVYTVTQNRCKKHDLNQK